MAQYAVIKKNDTELFDLEEFPEGLIHLLSEKLRCTKVCNVILFVKHQ